MENQKVRAFMNAQGAIRYNMTNNYMFRYILQKYKKILSQRNTLLKNHDVAMILDTLPVWDEQLCHYAAIIIKKRLLPILKLPFMTNLYLNYSTHKRNRQ